jgi:hypothetical protein
MSAALNGYRTIDSETDSIARDDADALMHTVKSLKIQANLLKATFQMVTTARAEGAINEAIESVRAAIYTLESEPEDVVDDENEGN